jgi:ATP-dependent NAD(P)H-hydrate dehydratase
MVSQPSAFSSIVVGPGLGRDFSIHTSLRDSDLFKPLDQNPERTVPFVFDADSLFPFPEEGPLFVSLLSPRQLSSSAILTPNEMEMRRLLTHYCPDHSITNTPQPPDGEKAAFAIHQIKRCETLLSEVNCLAIVLKGSTDVICVREGGEGNTATFDSLTCDCKGSKKRCGGIGDILSGCIGTAVSWFFSSKSRSKSSEVDGVPVKLGDALYYACFVARGSAEEAGLKKGRALGAKDVIEEVGPTFFKVFKDISSKYEFV